MLGIISDAKSGIELFRFWYRHHSKKTQLEKVLELIEDWYNYIDCNLEDGVNQSILNNKETKVINYIDIHLKNYEIRPSQKLIRKWNKQVGLRKDLLDNQEQFLKTSRLLYIGISLDHFFITLVGGFSTFYSKYKSADPSGCNFANISSPVKFFAFYVNSK
jgi:hypothetical protein